MAKQKSLKLPKRLMGVKVPKQTRKSVNRLLKSVPAAIAKPVVAAAVGMIATALAERIEQPLKSIAESGKLNPHAKHKGKGREPSVPSAVAH